MGLDSFPGQPWDWAHSLTSRNDPSFQCSWDFTFTASLVSEHLHDTTKRVIPSVPFPPLPSPPPQMPSQLNHMTPRWNPTPSLALSNCTCESCQTRCSPTTSTRSSLLLEPLLSAAAQVCTDTSKQIQGHSLGSGVHCVYVHIW